MRSDWDQEPARAPFTLVVDGREKQPYTFDGLRADAAQGGGPLVVTWEWSFLRSGDYSIGGYEDRVAIERKSLVDLYSTLGQHRERFEAEVERLAELEFAALVIESDWREILCHPPRRSQLNPKTIWRTCLAWTARYGVPWFPCGSRRLAEVATYRLLERWWLDLQEAEASALGRCRFCGRELTHKRSTSCGMGPVCRRKYLREDSL